MCIPKQEIPIWHSFPSGILIQTTVQILLSMLHNHTVTVAIAIPTTSITSTCIRSDVASTAITAVALATSVVWHRSRFDQYICGWNRFRSYNRGRSFARHYCRGFAREDQNRWHQIGIVVVRGMMSLHVVGELFLRLEVRRAQWTLEVQIHICSMNDLTRQAAVGSYTSGRIRRFRSNRPYQKRLDLRYHN